MNLISIVALFTLSVMVKGAWLAAVVQPVILSLGAILGTIDLDVLEMPFINKQAITKDDKEFADAIEKEFT